MHGHGHTHGHARPTASARRREHRRRLAWALGLAALYMVAEAIGGWWTGSLALLADAGHMGSDVASLALAFFALWMADRPPDDRRTYGHSRAEILAALAQGSALAAVAAVVAWEAVERIGTPPEVLGRGVLIVATGGLLVNLAALLLLSEGHESSMSMRGAWLHVISDALGSVAAIAAGAAIWAFGWHWADPTASIIICVLIVIGAWRLLGDAVDVLMETAPRHLEVGEIRDALAALHGVDAVHDLHVWTIGSGEVSLSCHVVARENADAGALVGATRELLNERFSITHTTVQVEPADLAPGDADACAGACEPNTSLAAAPRP